MLKVTGDLQGWERGMGQTPQSLHEELTSTTPAFQLQVSLLNCERINYYVFKPVGAGTLRPFIRVWLFVTSWTVALQAPLSMGFSKQEYWSGLTFPPPGDLPDPGIEPTFLESPVLADRLFTTRAIWEVQEWWQTVRFPCRWETHISQVTADLFGASALVIAAPPWPLFPEPLCLPLHVLNSRFL